MFQVHLRVESVMFASLLFRTFGIGGKNYHKHLRNGVGVSQSELVFHLQMAACCRSRHFAKRFQPESVKTLSSHVEGQAFEYQLSQTDDLQNYYLLLPSLVLSISRIGQ